MGIIKSLKTKFRKDKTPTNTPEKIYTPYRKPNPLIVLPGSYSETIASSMSPEERYDYLIKCYMDDFHCSELVPKEYEYFYGREYYYVADEFNYFARDALCWILIKSEQMFNLSIKMIEFPSTVYVKMVLARRSALHGEKFVAL